MSIGNKRQQPGVHSGAQLGEQLGHEPPLTAFFGGGGRGKGGRTPFDDGWNKLERVCGAEQQLSKQYGAHS